MFKQHSQISSLMFIIVIFFVLASLSSEFSLSPLIGAFIAGVIIQLLIKTPQIKKRIIQEVKHFAFAIVIPFFFIEIGMNLDILSLGEKSILPILFFLILIFAIFGKLLGTLIVKPFSRLSFRQLNFVGWGMNARGAIELVLAEIAFDHNLIDKALYSIIVLVVIITTFILPFILNYFIKRYPGMMNNVHNYKRNSRNRISNLNKS